MRVTLTETGGYANIRKGCTIETQQLPKGQAGKLERALCDGHIFGKSAKDNVARDARTFVIEVVCEGKVKSATFSETAAPEGARVVIDILRPYCRIIPATAR